MNILYLGSDRGEAQAVATALRGVAQNVSVAWTARPDHAARWIDQNADLAALVVEVRGDHGEPTGWQPVLEHVRALTIPPLVVAILPEGADQFESLDLEADEFLSRGESLLRDLPLVVKRRLDRAGTSPQAGPATLPEREPAWRADLEQKLARATAALEDAEKRHESEMAASAEQLARLQAQHEISLARAAATWEMVEEQLRDAATNVERSRRDRAAAVADAERLARRESELSSLLGEATAARLDLERRLAEAEGAVEQAGARAVQEQLAAAERFAARERELETRVAQATERIAHEIAARERVEETLAQALNDVQALAADVERLIQREATLTSTLAAGATSRADLERRLAATEAAFQETTERTTRERLAAARKAADREAELDGDLRQERDTRTALERDLAEAANARNSLAQRLADAETERDSLAKRLTEASAAIEAAADRERALDRQVADAGAVRNGLELQLAEAAQANADRDEHMAHERAGAAQRQADFELRLGQALDARDRLEEILARTRSDALDAERSFNEKADGFRARAQEEAARSQEQAARLEGQLAAERLEHAARVLELENGTRDLAQECDALRESLRAIEDQRCRLDEEHRSARERFEQDRAAAEAEIRRLADERLETARGHEEALARLGSAIAEREAQLQEQADRLASFQQSAEAARAEQQQDSQRMLAARSQEIDRLQRQLTDAGEAATKREEVLQAETAQVSRLRAQLEESRAEGHRFFQQAPLAMFRCTRDGALTEANVAWTTLVRRKIDELRGPDFAASVFESPTDLSWLVERCLSTRTRESIEATVRRRDGARLCVRLSARAASSDAVEVAAEDLTRFRILQDRLGQAHRMEAVGRLASEVGLTCSRLLDDVRENMQQWLMDAGSSTAYRHQGETLLDDLARAAGHLKKLAAYGDQQAGAPGVVDLHALLRDLAPVLKQVIGDDVEVRIPDGPSTLSLDVDGERVERLLVNLAAYGRARTPFGGRLIVEVGTTAVNRQFTARYPNVRPGPHALITVTEIRRAAPSEGLLGLRRAGTAHDQRSAMVGMPVDLRTLQGLVSECGGHLWMKVQPLGDIVAKIRLPLRTSFEQTPPRALAVRGGGARAIARWFQH
jgi:hypothetical protein